MVKIYNVYELNKIAAIGNNFPTLQNALFGAVTLILISMGILGMELDFIEDQVFHFQGVDLVKMY